MFKYVFLEFLRKKNACSLSLDWVMGTGYQSPELLWDFCPRGDWLLWLLTQINVSESLLLLVVAEALRRSLPPISKGRSRIARDENEQRTMLLNAILLADSIAKTSDLTRRARLLEEALRMEPTLDTTGAYYSLRNAAQKVLILARGNRSFGPAALEQIARNSDDMDFALRRSAKIIRAIVPRDYVLMLLQQALMQAR